MTNKAAPLLCLLCCTVAGRAQDSIPIAKPVDATQAAQIDAPRPAFWRPPDPPDASPVRMALAGANPLSGFGILSLQAAAATAGPAAPGAPSSHSPVGITIYDRARLDTWQWFEAPPKSETYAYLQNLLRIAVMQKTKHWDWQLELAQAAILDLPKDAIAPAPQGQLGLGGTYFAADGGEAYPAAAFLKQGFVRYHFAGTDRSLRIG